MLKAVRTALVLGALGGTNSPSTAGESSAPDALQSLAQITGTPIPVREGERCMFASEGEAFNIRLPKAVATLFDIPGIPGERWRYESASDTHSLVATSNGYRVTAGSLFEREDGKPLYWIVSAAGPGGQLTPTDLSAAVYSDSLLIKARLSEEFRSIAANLHGEWGSLDFNAETGKPTTCVGTLATAFGDFEVYYEQHKRLEGWYTLKRDDASIRLGFSAPNKKEWTVTASISCGLFESTVRYWHANRTLEGGFSAEGDGYRLEVLGHACFERERKTTYNVTANIIVEFGGPPRLYTGPHW